MFEGMFVDLTDNFKNECWLVWSDSLKLVNNKQEYLLTFIWISCNWHLEIFQYFNLEIS